MICRFCQHIRVLSGQLIAETPTLRIFVDICSHCGTQYRTVEKIEHMPKVDAKGLEMIGNVNR